MQKREIDILPREATIKMFFPILLNKGSIQNRKRLLPNGSRLFRKVICRNANRMLQELSDHNLTIQVSFSLSAD